MDLSAPFSWANPIGLALSSTRAPCTGAPEGSGTCQVSLKDLR